MNSWEYRRPGRGRETNGYCWLALVLSGWTLAALCLSYALPKTPANANIIGLAGLSAIPTGLFGLIFSILAIQPSVRQPGRYWHGSGVPIALVVVTGALNVFLVISLVAFLVAPRGLRRPPADLQSAQAGFRTMPDTKAELLRFEKYGFVYHKPAGWRQIVDLKNRPGTDNWVLGMVNSRGVVFAIIAISPRDDSAEAREKLLPAVRSDFQSHSTSTFECQDKSATFAGLEGRLFDVKTFANGREVAMCTWVGLTNKTLYRLEVGATAKLNADLEMLGTNMFAGFELK